MKHQSSDPPASRGFTLLEVLVSMVVGLGVILVMMNTLLMGTRGYDASTRRIDALVEARAAMTVLADDVATMLGTSTKQFGFEENDGRFQEIWFATLKPESAQDPEKAVGDICIVQYFTAVTEDAPITDSTVSRKLYRRLWSSGDLTAYLRNGSLPLLTPNPDEAEAIAFNVTRFVVQPMVSMGEGQPMGVWSLGNGTPAALEVSFQVVDDDTAGLFRSEEDWDLTSDLATELILEDDFTESRRGRDFSMKLKIGHANSL
ncbi:MAG: prepilin-type N-terminal cleavage/methylation domain-containing protein [Verrucomicrobiota bacterium JB023]|nr:prepilin-type N-terminal cleavage/methylation domain-containing protein [Verrucomicrobiota bacterium JB023]